MKYSIDILEIRLGEHDRSTSSETSITKNFAVNMMIKHPSYNDRTSENDIALVRLSTRADLSTYTPVCLPEAGQENFIGKLSTLIGWGNTAASRQQQTSVVDRQLATQLQELTGLKVVSDQSCASSIGSQPGYSNSDVTDDMLCAGGEVSKDSSSVWFEGNLECFTQFLI